MKQPWGAVQINKALCAIISGVGIGMIFWGCNANNPQIQDLTLSLALAAEILGSTSPLSSDPLQYLNQRWFSPQALTFPLPEGSRIAANFA